MVDWPWIGLALALVVEARHWVAFRWDFDDDAIGRAWQFSLAAIVITAMMIWLDGKRYTALLVLISWITPLLLPVQFVQSYGMRDSMPLREFSLFAKQRRRRNLRLGLTAETTVFNFGNVWFVTALLGAMVGTDSDTWLFLPGIIMLIGWKFISGCRGVVLLPVLAAAGLFALAGEAKLEILSNWIDTGIASANHRYDPNFKSTMIGTQGVVEQSQDIEWRIRPAEGSPVPPLLHINSFNIFLGSNWRNSPTSANDFKDLETRPAGEEICYVLRATGLSAKPWPPPSYSVRGAALPGSPLPLPGDAAELSNFDFDSIERNSIGMVRVFPKHSVISGNVIWRGGTNPEDSPMGNEDLRIPESESETIRNVVAGLQLERESTLNGKLAIIRAWFLKNFRYTRILTIRRPSYGGNEPTAIARFLTNARTGHCEYFATATTLMLREAGIPARYATGFAVVERDAKRGEYVIRGTHGHAWCRYWDPESAMWLDFDTTPPVGLALLTNNPSVMREFNDWLKRFREDFFLWRNQSSTRIVIAGVMLAIGIAAVAFVFRRLWRSKRRVSFLTQSALPHRGLVLKTPLHSLEKRAGGIIGPRPPGQTYAHWLELLRPNLPDSAPLDEAITLHQRMRFDPSPPPPVNYQRLTILVRQLDSALRPAGKSKRENALE
jgi:hypothetical protein